MTEKVLTEKERQEEIKRLTAIKEEAEHNANLQDVQQHAYKIFLNSVYRLYWDRIFSSIQQRYCRSSHSNWADNYQGDVEIYDRPP